MGASSIRRLALAALPVLAIGVGACGGGDDDPDGELSKAEFLSRGDAACEQARERFAEVREDPPTTPEEHASLTRGLIDISEDELEALRGLKGPPELDQPLARYLAAREKSVKRLRQGLEAAERGDAFAYAEAQRKVASGQVKRLTLARAVGFEVCGKLGSAG